MRLNKILKLNEANFSSSELEQLTDPSTQAYELSSSLMDKVVDYATMNAINLNMPYGTQKARDEDPHTWVADNFDKVKDHISLYAF